MKKKWGIVVAILLIVALIGAIVFVTMKDGIWIEKENNENGNNISGDAQSVIITSGEQTTIKDSTIEVGEFVIENLDMQYQDGYTFVKGDIVNNTEKDYVEGANFRISLYENDKLIITFPVLSSTLVAGGRSSFNTQLTLDCTLATNIVIDLVETK